VIFPDLLIVNKILKVLLIFNHRSHLTDKISKKEGTSHEKNNLSSGNVGNGYHPLLSRDRA